MKKIISVSLLALSFLIPSASKVLGDVTLKTKIDSGGFQGMGAFTSSVTQMIQGKKSRTQTDLKFKSKLMNMAAGKKNEVDITRVDLDKIWKCDLKKKTYQEFSISQFAKEMKKEEAHQKKAMQEMKEETPKENQPATHRVKNSSFQVKKLGSNKKINGFSTEGSQMTAMIEIEEIKTKAVNTYLMDTEIWAAPLTAELQKASKEQQDFSLAYLKRLGISAPKDMSSAFDPMQMTAMLGITDANAKNMMDQIQKELKKIKGYPIVTSSQWTVKLDPKVEAQKKAPQDEEEDELDTSSAEGLAGSMFGKFAKKSMKNRSEKKAKERQSRPMLSTYSEVLAVDILPISKDQFTIPKTFKRIDPEAP